MRQRSSGAQTRTKELFKRTDSPFNPVFDIKIKKGNKTKTINGLNLVLKKNKEAVGERKNFNFGKRVYRAETRYKKEAIASHGIKRTVTDTALSRMDANIERWREKNKKGGQL